MCGIAGKLSLDGQSPVDPELIQQMTDVIAYRGPDGQGKYLSGPVGLGHRRLSIIDLRPSGAQPMCNEDETVWIVFNGEIYNYQELRKHLVKAGHSFRSLTDTEVIIHLYEEFGFDCLAHLRGMFAFAVWDERRATLFVARDRVGIKPLYYTITDKAFLFGSEIKTLLVDPAVKRGVNHESLDCFLTYLYSPCEESIFKGIFKLPPAHYLVIRNGKVTKNRYWDLKYSVSDRWKTLDDAATELAGLLRRKLQDHMVSDVPVGFLASGGVDSTALLSFAVNETDKRIQTFTVGFGDAEFADERPYASLAAKQFGTIHRDITISADDFCRFLPSYVWHMEEPVYEPPAIALYYVAKLAREHVTVLLSGEGGDEAFGGYPEYRNFLMLEQFKAWAGPLRGPAASILTWAGCIKMLRRVKRYGEMMRVPLAEYYYSRTSSPFTRFSPIKRALYTDEFARVTDESGAAQIARGIFSTVDGQHLLNQMLYVDTKTWLPDDLLIKADRLTMATSIELRVPFLDHEVLEFAAELPTRYKVRGFDTKRVLKRAFRGRVPEQILRRRKTGFPVPFEKWLGRELRDYVLDTVLSRRAVNRGYFKRKEVERLLKEGEAAGNRAPEAFSLLILELWHQQFIDCALPSTIGPV